MLYFTKRSQFRANASFLSTKGTDHRIFIILNQNSQKLKTINHWNKRSIEVNKTIIRSKDPLELIIGIICPCIEYPLKPHFYIVNLGFAGVCLFFLFLLQNIDCGYSLEPPQRENRDCGYSLEPPQRGGSNVYPQSMF